MTTATTDLARHQARCFAAWSQGDLAAALCVIADTGRAVSVHAHGNVATLLTRLDLA
jgi:hypothetical protein